MRCVRRDRIGAHRSLPVQLICQPCARSESTERKLTLTLFSRSLSSRFRFVRTGHRLCLHLQRGHAEHPAGDPQADRLSQLLQKELVLQSGELRDRLLHTALFERHRKARPAQSVSISRVHDLRRESLSER